MIAGEREWPGLLRRLRRDNGLGGAFLINAYNAWTVDLILRADLMEYGEGLGGHVRVFANTTAVTDFLLAGSRTEALGSNNWVVDGEPGIDMLAVDPRSSLRDGQLPPQLFARSLLRTELLA